MITYHWADEEDQEISSNVNLPASGKLIIRIARGSKDFKDYQIELYDPFGVLVTTYRIPHIEHGEYFQIIFPLGNYLVRGTYTVLTKKPNGTEGPAFKFNLQSRRTFNQVFVLENNLFAKNMKGRVMHISLEVLPVPESLFLQSSGIVYPGRGINYEKHTILAENLWGNKQKTVKWFNIVQPAFLPLNAYYLYNQPDEYYVLNNVDHFVDEPGLEISHPKLHDYTGYDNPHFPLRILKDVIHHVHLNMKYVKQNQERGLLYALETGKGDCTEYSAFVVSLLRKLGIQSRLMSGMARTSFNNWISHAFVEVFIYGNWFPLDVMKPSKPYLQIGNRGDLIGISRKNWLDTKQSELAIKMQAGSEIRPKFEFERNVTEAGIKSIPQKHREKPRNSLLFKREKLKSKISQKTIYVEQVPDSTNTIALIDGTFNLGSIVSLHYYTQGRLSIDLKEIGFTHENTTLLAVNRKGTILAYALLKTNQLKQS